VDDAQFDDLTRAVGGEHGTRRTLLRILSGSALAALARFGLATLAEAKQGKGKGKNKGKGKGKDKDKKPDQPQPCGPNDHRCDGGACVGPNQCCPDEKKCADPESPAGFACVGKHDCCTGQKRCSGRCIHARNCCPDDPRPSCGRCGKVSCVGGEYVCSEKCCTNEKACPGGECVGKSACCPGELRCDDGSCVSVLDCCPNQKPCPDGTCVGQTACCLGEKKCPDGECIPEDQCCPSEAPPVCPECEVAICRAGEWGCEHDETCGPPCGDGYCPNDMFCHHTGACCRLRKPEEGGQGYICQCASGYTGGCNGQCCKRCCYPYCCDDPRASRPSRRHHGTSPADHPADG
jgi:hypothetical protein